MTLADLLPMIEAKTQEGKLVWEEWGANAFAARLDDEWMIEIQKSDRFTLSLLNKEGRTLESLSAAVNFGLMNVNAHLDTLRKIHEHARRHALGVDDALQSARRALERL